ncbi:hypothetical protein MHBO_003450 [Bonamia ostreae]|uniref:Uncharacterized protein n=1 Tax=Bonamia ostreae TaxID=126728 RepID=A0ABV2ARE3_9EUKA
MNRWKKTTNPNINKGNFALEEDIRIILAKRIYGDGNWKDVVKHVPKRTDMKCRERYCNVLDNRINKSRWTVFEDNKLNRLVKRFGTGKWSVIAKEMEGRTDNQIWRRWKLLNSL